MKKILLLMVGMLVAFASQAQLYLVGPGVGKGDWNPAQSIEVQAVDGWYTFELTSTEEFQMSKILGEWGDFNKGILGRNGDWTGSADSGLQSCKLQQKQENFKFNAPNAAFKYVRVKADYSEMQWSTSSNFSGGSTPVDPTVKYEIKSSVDGSSWPLHEMLPDGNGNYVYTYTDVQKASSDRGMGMQINGKWKGTSNNEKVFDGRLTTYKMMANDGGNIQISKDFAGDILCSYNPADQNLTLSVPEGDDGWRLHIHTMEMLNNVDIFPFDVNQENPYKLSITINAPLANDVPLCVHHREGGAEYVSYGYENATTYLPEGDGTTGALKAFSVEPGNEASRKYITLPKGLQGTIDFAVSVVENIPAELTISGGKIGENLYTYVLWDNFNSAALEKTQIFVPHTGHFDVTYNFTGEEQGRLFKVERLLNGQTVTGRRWCVARNTAEYVPSELGMEFAPLSATGTDNVVLPEGLRGQVTISVHVDADGVPEKFVIRGGHIGDAPDAPFTVYFYDTTTTGSHNAPYAYMWRQEVGDQTAEFTPWWSGTYEKSKMTSTGKYIKKGEDYYPVYQLSFSWEKNPQYIIIHNDNNKYTGGTNGVFVNGGFYHSGSEVAETGLNLVDKPGEQPVTFYMHWKEDWIKTSQMGDDGKPKYAPRCYAYSGNLPDAWTVWNNAKEMSQIEEYAPNISSDPNMFAVEGDKMTITEKYQIWKCDFTGPEMAGKTDVAFVMMGDDNKPWIYASRSGGFAEPEFLTKYIFATATEKEVRYAVQSFIPYDDFKQLDKQGRPSLYLVGNDDGAIEGLKWNAFETHKFDMEQGCFYIPVNVSTDGKDAQFKMSWISPTDAIERNGVTAGKDDSARAWATFDLGIIGVDDYYQYPNGYQAPEFKKAYEDDVVQSALCRPYESIAYMNYNQYNWFISKDYIKLGGKCYVVVDPHSTCRTVTVIPYDPNPSVGLSASDFGTMTLTPEQAKAFHGDHSGHLNGASHNGHIYMDRVNYCSGDIEIHKSHEGLREKFDLTYNIYMNGDMVLEHDNPDEVLHLDYMPMAASGNIGIRCTYQNKVTDLTFHSKLGVGTFDMGEVNFPQPQPVEVSAVKVLDPGVESNPGMIDRPGVVLLDVPFIVDATEYEYYADFEFEVGERAEIIHPDHRLAKSYDWAFGDKTLNGWQFLDYENNYDFDNHSNDWSSHFANSDNNASIYLTNTGDKITNIEGTLYAVYPFFYQNNPTIKQNAKGVAKAPAATADFTPAEYSVTNIKLPVPLTAIVQDGVISGVEDVLGDADADAEAEYYTISGIRVMGQPTPGIYLCRKGDKVTKVVVR